MIDIRIFYQGLDLGICYFPTEIHKGGDGKDIPDYHEPAELVRVYLYDADVEIMELLNEETKKGILIEAMYVNEKQNG